MDDGHGKSPNGFSANLSGGAFGDGLIPPPGLRTSDRIKPSVPGDVICICCHKKFHSPDHITVRRCDACKMPRERFGVLAERAASAVCGFDVRQFDGGDWETTPAAGKAKSIPATRTTSSPGKTASNRPRTSKPRLLLVPLPRLRTLSPDAPPFF